MTVVLEDGSTVAILIVWCCQKLSFFFALEYDQNHYKFNKTMVCTETMF